MTARLPAEVGALVLKAIEAAVEVSSTPNPPAVMHFNYVPDKDPIDEPSRSARQADALGLLAEAFLHHGAEAMSGGDRHQVIVHVSAETLKRSAAGCCEIEDGASISAETARRLACDASIVALIENEKGEPLNVGRKTRTIPPAIRRLLNARDRGCRFPGCTHARYVDAHHIHYWAHGGETKPSNLVSLCRFHHRKVHEGDVKIHVLDDGALRFLHPNGDSFDGVAPNRTQPLGDWRQLPATHREQGIHIDQNTAAGRWDGERMDYGMCIEGMFLTQQRERRAQQPSS